MNPVNQLTRKDFVRGLFHQKDKPTFNFAGIFNMNQQSNPSHSYVRMKREAMKTVFEVIFGSNEPPRMRYVGSAMLNEIDRIESALSIWKQTSELITINKRAFYEPVKVSLDIYNLIKLSKQLHKETDGAFDITSTPLSRCWGFFNRQGKFPTPEEIRKAKEHTGMHHIELDETNHTVFFNKKGLELNPAAIGKGFALDQARQIADRNGLNNVMLSGGFSSVWANGKPIWKPAWHLSIRNPLNHQHPIGRITLTNKGYSSSGFEAQSFTHDGQTYGHIIDPRTGWPVNHMLNINVIAPSAVLAEALSTAFFVMGINKTLDYCKARPEIGVMILTIPDQHGKGEIITANIDSNEMEVSKTSWTHVH